MTRRARVLIVDHDLDALYYVDHVLAELGYYPIKATAVEDAAEIIGAMHVDAIVLNAGMLACASYDALEQLQRTRDSTAILVMTSTGARPGGAYSPLRRFLEHPPAAEDLALELESCAAAPARSTR